MIFQSFNGKPKASAFGQTTTRCADAFGMPLNELLEHRPRTYGVKFLFGTDCTTLTTGRSSE